ncbi:hypothetical protein HK096_005727 [Nowakowskiella sp. JEL0078]|nr:hypothetical protein HK096_005727 [Nowakowskiella sp. JEL0078]
MEEELLTNEDAAFYYQNIRLFIGSSYNANYSTLKSKAISNQQRLQKLSNVQFTELAVDVHDEVIRLDAREKLSTLPSKRFSELANSVVIELERRFPDCLILFNENTKQNIESNSTISQNENTRNIPSPPPRTVRPNSKQKFFSPTKTPDTVRKREKKDNSVFNRVSAHLKRLSVFPDALEPRVNLEIESSSMDNLLADLDLMLLTSRNPITEPIQIVTERTQIEKIKEEYEPQIKILKSKIQELKRNARRSVALNIATNEEKLMLLEDDLAEELWAHTLHLDGVQSQLLLIQEERKTILDENEYQKKIVFDIRKETSGLSEELQNYIRRRDMLVLESEQLDIELATLEKENKRLRELSSEKGLSTNSNSTLDLLENLKKIAQVEGILDSNQLLKYQSAANEFLQTISTSQPPRFSVNNTSMNFFASMRRIILACHGIMENIQEQRGKQLSEAENEFIDDGFETMQIALEGLLTEVKLLSSPSKAKIGTSERWTHTIQEIELAVECLDEAIVSLVAPFGVKEGIEILSLS